ncbi:MAG TPA: hypothetical protein VF179_19105, partial [Thermoanaerobaculia bacterium]|nr:hypothetical protein [Thermoanaerobaculia bacterium]
PMPGFSRRLDSLLVRYSGEVAVPEGDPRLVAIYGRCNRLVSSWAAAIGGEAAEDTLARAMEELLPPLLSAFQDQAKVVDGSGADLPVRELELFLECYEMLLGMARRAAYRSVKVDYLEFMLNAAESPFWIVRWWAFYNISYLVAGLPASDDYEYTVEECLDWMITQVYRTSEPIGLKHRQCALLEYTVKERPQSRAALRALFARRPPLDERKVEQVYANILRERATARRSLEDYFRKVSMLSRMDP